MLLNPSEESNCFVKKGTIVRITTSLSGEIIVSNPSYRRIGETRNDYYYDANEIIVDRNGTYTILSNSSNVLIGYLYENAFNSNETSENLLISSSSTNEENTFEMSFNLNENERYVLVMTTRDPNETSSYNIQLSGPGYAAFDNANPDRNFHLFSSQMIEIFF